MVDSPRGLGMTDDQHKRTHRLVYDSSLATRHYCVLLYNLNVCRLLYYIKGLWPTVGHFVHTNAT